MAGSHGGGSHGGGGFHGGGYHGGGHSSGGHGSGGGVRYSNSPFMGAIMYSYIARNGMRRTFYYNGTPKKQALWMAFLMPAIIFVFVVAFVAIMLSTTMSIGKLDKKYVKDTNIVISDTTSQLSENGALYSSLTKFYDKTGIVPYIFSIEKSEFPLKDYTVLNDKTMEQYAFNRYTNLINDEGHLLILIVFYDNDPNNYYWCDCTGDNAMKIFDDTFFDKFQSLMQKNLEKESLSRETALANAFNDSAEWYGKPLSRNGYNIMVALVVLVVFGGAAILIGFTSYKSIKGINDYIDAKANGRADGSCEAASTTTSSGNGANGSFGSQTGNQNNSQSGTNSNANNGASETYSGESEPFADSYQNAKTKTEDNVFGGKDNTANTKDSDDTDWSDNIFGK